MFQGLLLAVINADNWQKPTFKQKLTFLARFLPNLGPMKKWSLILMLLPMLVQAQDKTLFAYMDFNRFCKVFSNNYFFQLDHNEVYNLTLGDNLIAYQNAQKDFKIYDGNEAKLITNQMVNFKQSDNLVAWNIGSLLYYWENGKPHNITAFGGDYAVGDSLVVFQDTRFNTLNVIYKGETIQLMQQTEEMYMPEVVGDNVVVFRDNGENYKVFWRGEIFEIGVWSGAQKIQFVAGTDIVAFNDPNTRTFAVFENGEFIDVEQIWAGKMKAGRGFVAYEDVQGNLKVYGKGKQSDVASFNQFWDAKDDLLVWGEANSTFIWHDGEKKQVLNYTVKEWKLKNDVLAFKTNVGGVGACVNGKTQEITNMTNTEFVINGHGVMVTLANKSVIILSQGQLFRD